jgi:hypothetical protein
MKAAIVLALFAMAAADAAAIDECTVTYGHHVGRGAARVDYTVTERLAAGESRRLRVPDLNFVRNHGPHDLRVAFAGGAPRRLAKGEIDPPAGYYLQAAALETLTCLPAMRQSAPTAAQ